MKSGSLRRAIARRHRARVSSPGRLCGPGRRKDRHRADCASTAPEPEAPVPACRPHVGVARRDPHPHSARNWNHDSPRTLRTRRSASASTSLSTRTRFPEPTSISIVPGFGRRPFVAARNGLVASGTGRGAVTSISTGSKIEPSLLIGSAVRASLRHVKSRPCATPCRRATSLTTAPGASVSSMIPAFSSLLQRRRRSNPRTFPSIST